MKRRTRENITAGNQKITTPARNSWCATVAI